MRRMLVHWLVLGAICSPFATFAAPPDQLFVLRDMAVADGCAPAGDPALGTIDEAAFGTGARLYIVPCRATFADVMSVVIVERSGALRTVAFPDPGVAFGNTWKEARMNRIGVAALLSSPRLLPDGTLVASSRIAPGLGAGHVVQHYAFEEGVPVLTRFTIELDGQPPIVLWPTR